MAAVESRCPRCKRRRVLVATPVPPMGFSTKHVVVPMCWECAGKLLERKPKAVEKAGDA